LAAHGVTIIDEEAVAKYLRVVPPKYTQIALSIKTLIDMSTLTLEDVIGRLRAMDEHVEAATASADSKLLLTEEEWAARMREKRSGEGSSSHGGNGKRRGKASQKKKKQKDGGDTPRPLDKDTCRRCGKTRALGPGLQEPPKGEEAGGAPRTGGR
jgi:hypothetical protein